MLREPPGISLFIAFCPLQLINYDQPSNKCMASGRHPLNVSKNRRPDLLPSELHRVRLSPKSGVECSDYVNASWLPGFSKLDEFVVTQHPLTATVAAFWQMVWEHNAQTIVLLSPVDDQVRVRRARGPWLGSGKSASPVGPACIASLRRKTDAAIDFDLVDCSISAMG